MNTLLLSPGSWDLLLDSSGNIALATEPYSLAQDAASAIRTLQGEVYYDTTQGIPYMTEVFNGLPPLELYRAQCVAAALTVPDVSAAQVFFTGIDETRTLSGQVQVTGPSGQSATGF